MGHPSQDFRYRVSFIRKCKKIAAIRNTEPALALWKVFTSALSPGDSFHVAVSVFKSGILAWSRILNDEES